MDDLRLEFSEMDTNEKLGIFSIFVAAWVYWVTDIGFIDALVVYLLVFYGSFLSLGIGQWIGKQINNEVNTTTKGE